MTSDEKINVLAKAICTCVNALCSTCTPQTGVCPFTLMKCDPRECENAELFQKIGEIAHER